MDTERQHRTGATIRIRERARDAGTGAIAVLSISTMLVLAAGLAPHAGRVAERVAAGGGAAPVSRLPGAPIAVTAPIPDASTGTSRYAVAASLGAPSRLARTEPGDRVVLLEALPAAPLEGSRAAAVPAPSAADEAPSRDRFATGPDHGEPAIARAAEAGLQRMRVQFAQAIQQPSHVVPEGLESLAAAAVAAFGSTAGLVSPSTAQAGAPEPVRDVRDPRSMREEARSPAPPLERSRTIALPGSGEVVPMAPGEAGVTWIGDATLLVRGHGFNVLVDPNFLRRGEVARLGFGRSAPRRADPAFDFDTLPPIDAVFVSRLRDDRFDRIMRRKLSRDVPVVAPPEARAELVALGFSSVHTPAAWSSLKFVRGRDWVQVTPTPTRAAPPLLSALATGSHGALVEFGRDGTTAGAALRIWISGETAIDDALLAELAPRLEDLDLAVLHVGGAGLPGLAGAGTMDEAGARAAIRRLAPRHAAALRLDDHAERDLPQQALQAVAGTPVVMPERGATLRLAPPQRWAAVEVGPLR